MFIQELVVSTYRKEIWQLQSLKLTASLPLKIGRNCLKRKWSYSNHPFSGANCSGWKKVSFRKYLEKQFLKTQTRNRPGTLVVFENLRSLELPPRWFFLRKNLLNGRLRFNFPFAESKESIGVPVGNRGIMWRMGLSYLCHKKKHHPARIFGHAIFHSGKQGPFPLAEVRPPIWGIHSPSENRAIEITSRCKWLSFFSNQLGCR